MSDACPPGLCAMRSGGGDLATMCESLRVQLAAALEVVAAADAMRVAGITSSWQGGKFLPSPEAQAFDAAREKLRRLQDG